MPLPNFGSDTVADVTVANHIHTAGFDLLRDEEKAYADALVRAGVHHVCLEQMIHHFYAMGGAIPLGAHDTEGYG